MVAQRVRRGGVGGVGGAGGEGRPSFAEVRERWRRGGLAAERARRRREARGIYRREIRQVKK